MNLLQKGKKKEREKKKCPHTTWAIYRISLAIKRKLASRNMRFLGGVERKSEKLNTS